MTTLPAIPTEWLKRSDIVIQEGCNPVCTALRPWNEATPYVVHTAIFLEDGTIGYEQGDYCFTLEQAEEAFEARS